MDEALANPLGLMQAMQAEAMLPEGESLRALLAEDYARVAEQAREAGFDLALLDHFLMRRERLHTYRTDHIWTIRDGKCASWLERPGDQATFDQVWS